MNRVITVLCLTAAFLFGSLPVHAQQANPDNRKELERIGLIATAAGSVLIASAVIRGDWETRLCPHAGELWREVQFDPELCAPLLNEKLIHLKPEPDKTLTAIGVSVTAIGIFTYFLSKRYPKAPDLSIRVTPAGARISHTFSW